METRPAIDAGLQPQFTIIHFHNFFTNASLTLVLLILSRGACVWNSWNMRSKCRCSIPGPLPLTLNCR